MDDTPTVLMVNKSMYGKVLKLQTSAILSQLMTGMELS